MPVTTVPPNILSAPVGALMRPTAKIAPEDTLERASQEFRRNGCGVLPVVDNGILCGVVTDFVLARALAESVNSLEAVSAISVAAQTIPPYATGAEALRRLAEGDGLPLVVIDDLGRPMGVLGGADLYVRRRAVPRPAMVGGMATPFGVYLTNGSERAGAKWYGLMATGATLFLLLTVAAIATDPLGNWLANKGLSQAWVDNLTIAATMGLFLLGMRLIPLAGTHGAEHQVVHAIERGEELTPEVVRRMPRVHPRCGTNLAVGLTLFLGISSAEWIPAKDLRALIAAIVTFGLWRPLGSLLQQHVTTRRPNDAQLASGIRAANELLDKFATSKNTAPSFGLRLWNSGLLFVLMGNFLAFGVYYALSVWFHLPLLVGTIS